jgi:3-hydroxybutyryl-CoA dehydrogenase
MSLSKIAVIGAGTMGNGIAQVSAAAGFEVLMIDVSEAALDRGLAIVELEPRSAGEKGKLDERGARPAALAPDPRQRSNMRNSPRHGSRHRGRNRESRHQAAHHDVRPTQIIRHDAVLATNTSSISITALAAATVRPERCGRHAFFQSRCRLMGLVELIRGLLTTSDATQKRRPPSSSG